MAKKKVLWSGKAWALVVRDGAGSVYDSSASMRHNRMPRVFKTREEAKSHTLWCEKVRRCRMTVEEI